MIEKSVKIETATYLSVLGRRGCYIFLNLKGKSFSYAKK